MDPRKQAICDALRAFIQQRPGFDPRNYSDAASYRSDQRTATRQLHDAWELLQAVRANDGITADAMLAACGGGRVQIKMLPIQNDAGFVDMPPAEYARIDYTTGQYWCTEFRGAIARYLASLLWDWTREHAMPIREDGGRYETFGPKPGGGLMSAGDWLRAHFRREFGKGLAGRYFA